MNFKKSFYFFIIIFIAYTNIEMSADDMYFGIGAGINPLNMSVKNDDLLVPMELISFYFPIQIAEEIRIEPEIGLYTAKKDIRTNTYTSTNSETLFKIGAGAFITMPKGDIRTYLGGRFAFLFANEDDEETAGSSSETGKSQTIVVYSACFGAEYLFNKNFCAGIEMQLNYLSVGKVEESPLPSVEVKRDQYALSTGAVIFLRFFF